MDERVAKLTAKWWREKIKKNDHNNGDCSMTSMMAGVLANRLASNHTPTTEQLDKFEHKLGDLIELYSGSCLQLYCDYHPDQILSKAAEYAGINTSVFPWKTGTKTDSDKVFVSDGYGASYVEITESDFE
jgi:hypothetical protein